MTVDITKTVAPKSDQLNADDLLGGKTKTIKITGVKSFSEDDQPIGIQYEGDNGKPWKPCKGMRRVLIDLWGDAAAREADTHYKGRTLVLFRDPDIKFGGTVMGGIRISHASNIDTEKKILVTTAKARRIEFVVKPYVEQKQDVDDRPAYVKTAASILRAIKSCNDLQSLNDIMQIDYKDDLDLVALANEETYKHVMGEFEKKRSSFDVVEQ